MPRLLEPSDGCRYVHHFYRDHATWQVDRRGVLFLRERGINDGDKFSTELFMDMWQRGLVYTEAGLERERESLRE